jgi:hypothetical protein
MDTVLDVAFVLAVTAFLNKQFGLADGRALIAAFFVALVFAYAPLIVPLFPAVAPFVDAFLKLIVLFLGAAGAYDFLRPKVLAAKR